MPHANGNGSTHNGSVPNNVPRLIHLPDGTAFEVGQAAGRLAAQAHSGPTLQRVEIVARSLADGTELELVRDPSRGDGLGLLVWKARTRTVVPEFSYQSHTFIPPRLDPSIAESLRLPVAPLQQCGAPEQILADLVATVGRYFPLPGDALLLIAHT